MMAQSKNEVTMKEQKPFHVNITVCTKAYTLILYVRSKLVCATLIKKKLIKCFNEYKNHDNMLYFVK